MRKNNIFWEGTFEVIIKDTNDSILAKNGMSFYDTNKLNIYYLCEYLPTKYLNKMNIEDPRSKDFILEYKNKNAEVINKVYNFLKLYLASNFTITVIPSSQENSFDSASHILARKIIEHCGSSNNLIDGSHCLRRHRTIEKQHLSTQKREIATHLDSIVVDEMDKIEGENILLLDDIVTSGKSIQACTKLLKEAGARKVVAFVVGKTFNGYNKRPAFIFDLDQTLYDTSDIKIYRDNRNWKEACNLAEKIKNKPYPGVQAFIDDLYSNNLESCIVTRSPRNYAKIFADALGIQKIVAYHDVNNKKDKLEAYLKAKQLLQIYERDIFVVGDEETDIIPAAKLSMNTVRITTEQSIATYKYDTFEKFRIEMEKIISENYNIHMDASEDNEQWLDEIPF